MNRQLNDSELRQFCFVIGQDYDALLGNKRSKINELILYWERLGDFENFAVRYQEWEAKRHPPDSQFPIRPKIPVPNQRPSLPEHFVGREEELARLQEILQPGHIVTLCGPGGMGKSTLATKVLHVMDDGRFPDGIVWHNFYSQPHIADACGELLRSHGQTPTALFLAQTRALLHERRLIWVLDGAEAVAEVGENIADLFAVRGSACLLVTSRLLQDVPDSGRYMDVGHLSEEDGVHLLNNLAPDSATEIAATQALVRKVGGWPFALIIAGRYMFKSKNLPSEYLAWLNETPWQALSLQQRDHQKNNAKILLDRSVARLTKEARDVLALIGWLALAPFDKAWLEKPLKPDIVRKGLDDLVNYGFLTRSAKLKLYAVSHALIQAYAHDHLPLHKAIRHQLGKEWERLARAETQNGLAGKGYGQLPTVRLHILAYADYCVPVKAWTILNALAEAMFEYLTLQGFASANCQLLLQGIRSAQFLNDPLNEALHLNRLGLSYSHLGQLHQAIKQYEQSLKIFCQLENFEGKRYEGAVLTNFGSVYWYLGDLSKAVEYHQQALIIAHEVKNIHDKGAGLNNLGIVYLDLKEIELAIDCFHKALDIAHEIKNHRYKGVSLCNWGNAYRDLGQIGNAINYYEEALDIGREIGDRAIEAYQLGYLGEAYCLLGDLEKGWDYYQQGKVIFQEIGDINAETKIAWRVGKLLAATDRAQAIALMAARVAYEEQIGHVLAAEHAAEVERLRQESGEAGG